MKILIYISKLSSGGAEKVASLMSNYWANKYSVILLTNTSVNTDFYEINDNVKRCSTNLTTPKKNTLIKIKSHITGLWQLRTIVKEESPNVIISHNATSNVRILIATLGLNIPVIVEDHNNPAKSKNTKQPWKMLRPLAYYFAEHIVLLTQDLVQHYPGYLHRKVVLIPNPLDVPENIPESNEIILKKPTFISTGNFRGYHWLFLLRNRNGNLPQRLVFFDYGKSYRSQRGYHYN